MVDLDALIDEAVMVGTLTNGASPEILAARGFEGANELAAVVGSKKGTFSNRWTDRELAQFKEELTYLTIEEIAERHGRSINAVKVKLGRMGYGGPTKQDGEISATALAKKMGVCGKLICRLVDEGRMPGRVASTVANIRMISLYEFKRWVIHPANWIYFSAERIKDRKIRRLVQHAQGRWPDAWWTAGDVVAYHGLTNSHAVNQQIWRGKLPAVRWRNWHILRSDAMAARFYTADNPKSAFTPAGDDFIQLAAAVGLMPNTIVKLMGNEKRKGRYVTHRLLYLARKGRVAPDVQTRDGVIFADWRQWQRRFPTLVATMRAFAADERPLAPKEVDRVRFVLARWGEWYGQTADRQETARRWRNANSAKEARVRRMYKELLGWGVDPLEGVG